MIKELKIGETYKAIKEIFTYSGPVLVDEIFTIIKVEKGPGLPDPFLEYPDYPIDSLYVTILHDNQIKKIKTLISDHYDDVVEVC